MVDKPVKLECPHCGYSWEYNGQHVHPVSIQCRSCNKSFEIPEDPEVADLYKDNPRVI